MTALIHNRKSNQIEQRICETVTVTDQYVILLCPDTKENVLHYLPKPVYRLAGTTY